MSALINKSQVNQVSSLNVNGGMNQGDPSCSNKIKRSIKAKKSKTNIASQSLRSAFAMDPSYDYHIFVDGSCWPNPGPSGYGIAVYKKHALYSVGYSGYDANGTNNRAELQGIVFALKLAAKAYSRGATTQIFSDSEYAINAVTVWSTGWRKKGLLNSSESRVKNPELVKEALQLYEPIKHKVRIDHVKSHSGVEGNEIADRLAKMARTKKIKRFKILTGDDKKRIGHVRSQT